MNKGDFNNIKIPKELDKFIEDTISTVDSEKIKSNKIKRIKHSSSIAAILTITTLLFISNPAIASKLPFLGDIFKYLNSDIEKIYETYSEYSTEINISKESNGIRVTLKDAIFDGRLLNFTYMIESNRDLGFYPILGINSIKTITDNYDNELIYLNGRQEKIDENNYIGQATYKINENAILNNNDKLNFVITWKDIVLLNDGGGISKSTFGDEIKLEGDIKEIVSGEWNFNVEVNAVENDIKKVNETVKNDLYEFTVDEISISPVSFNINYNYLTKEAEKKGGEVYPLDIEVKDDLGNEYLSQGYGVSGNGTTWWRNSTFERINENATELIITPRTTEKYYEGFNNNYKVEEQSLDPIIIKIR